MFDFSWLWGGGKRGSKNQAKERLQLILVHDRSSLSPELLDLMKNAFWMLLLSLSILMMMAWL